MNGATPECDTSTSSVIASRVPSGTTSQPSRQPVITQVLEKLLQTMTRSSGSATSSNDGAACDPSYTSREYTSSEISHTRRRRAISRIVASSSRVAVQPVGLFGVFRMNARAPSSMRIEPLEIHAEAAFRQRGQRQLVHLRAAQPRRVADIRPGRAVQHHAVAGTHRGGERHRHRCHAGRCELDALFRHRLCMQRSQILGERETQFRQAAHIRIARRAGIQRGNRGLMRAGGLGWSDSPKHRKSMSGVANAMRAMSRMREPGSRVMSIRTILVMATQIQYGVPSLWK